MKDLVIVSSSYGEEKEILRFCFGLLNESLTIYYLNHVVEGAFVDKDFHNSFIILTPEAEKAFHDNLCKQFFTGLRAVSDYSSWTTIEHLKAKYSKRNIDLQIKQIKEMIDL